MTPLANAPSLTPWLTFYEILGCSGGALVGLQFVVIALLVNSRARADFQAINAFGTPNVVHFAAALTLSAIMTAPWPSLLDLTLAIALAGILGLAYSLTICQRAGKQTAYKPVFEDWLFYAILPCMIYTNLAASALIVQRAFQIGLFMIAATSLSLLLIGIRNSWDSVTHIVAGNKGPDADKLSQSSSSPSGAA